MRRSSVALLHRGRLPARRRRLAEFSGEAIRDPDLSSLAERVHYEIDPDDEYPHNYSGRIRATLADGRVVEAVQPHLRGGAREPLGREELRRKCAANLAYAGADQESVQAIAEFAEGLAAAAAVEVPQ